MLLYAQNVGIECTKLDLLGLAGKEFSNLDVPNVDEGQ